MAVNLHKNEDDYNKKVATPGSNSGVSTSGVTPAAEPTAKPLPMVEKSDAVKQDNKGIGISKGPEAQTPKEPTIDDEYQALKEKLLKGELKEEDLTVEQKNLIASYEKKSEDYEKKAKNIEDISPEKAKRLTEYNRVMTSSRHNAYEKTSFIMDQYLLQNDKEYKKLPEYHLKEGDKGYDYKKDLRRQYRDGIIHDLQEKLNPGISSKNLDLKRRQAGFAQIAKIFILCDKEDRTIESMASLSREEILKKLADNEYEMLGKLFEKANVKDKNLSAYQKLNNVADVMLSDNPRYKNLKTDEDKEKFRQKYITEALGKVFNFEVSEEFLKDPKNESLLNAALELQRVLEQDKVGLDQFTLLSNKNQAQYILKALEKTQSKLPKEKQEFLEYSKVKFQVLADIKDKDNATERDILEYLEKIPEEKRTEAQNELLKGYKHLSNSILNEKAELSSIATIALLSDTPPDKVALARVDYHLKGKKNLNDLMKDPYFKRFVHDVEITGDADIDSAVFKHISKKLNISESDVINAFNTKAQYTGRRAMAQAYGSKKANKIVMAKYNGSFIKDKETQKELLAINRKGSATLDKQTINEIETNQLSEIIAKNNPNFAKASWQGYNANKNLSNQDRTEIQDNIQNANFSDEYKQFTTKTMVTTASADQQKYYIEHYKDTTNQNLIKGFAAAEPEVDASVKQEYSQTLDQIIENNGLQNDKEIKNLRETGQTSYEREQAAKTSGEETKRTESNSASQTSNSSPSSSTKQGSGTSSSGTTSAYPQGAKVTVGTLYVSHESKIYTKEIKATLAMLDSEAKKAEAMKKVADNIAKIKAESIKYEEKTEKKKTEEQQKLAQSIKQENKTKTEEQLKAELSSALDSEIAAIEQEISTTPEAQEVQKQFGELFTELRSYAKAGQMDQVFSMLSKIPKAQEKFLEKLATKHISTITHFLKGADKSVLKFMCEKNPGIISTLDTNTLMTLCEAGFPKTMIIKYGDKNQIAGMLTDLQLASTKETLNEFYEVMGIAKDEQETADASEVVKKNDKLANGGDDHMAKLLENMKKASNDIASAGIQGTVVANWKEPEKRVPRELWG